MTLVSKLSDYPFEIRPLWLHPAVRVADSDGLDARTLRELTQVAGHGWIVLQKLVERVAGFETGFETPDLQRAKSMLDEWEVE